MPRPIIIKKDTIWRRRQSAYVANLERHKFAIVQQYRQRVLESIQHIRPTLDIFGEMDKELHRAEIFEAMYATMLTDPDLINPWLWSEEGWKKYQDAFNALEEPTTDYRMIYNKEFDRIEYQPCG